MPCRFTHLNAWHAAAVYKKVSVAPLIFVRSFREYVELAFPGEQCTRKRYFHSFFLYTVAVCNNSFLHRQASANLGLASEAVTVEVAGDGVFLAGGKLVYRHRLIPRNILVVNHLA